MNPPLSRATSAGVLLQLVAVPGVVHEDAHIRTVIPGKAYRFSVWLLPTTVGRLPCRTLN